MYTYNEGTNEWEELYDSIVLLEENLVQARVNHLSIFGLGGLLEIITGTGDTAYHEETGSALGWNLFPHGGGGGGGGGGGCFIATAVYDSPMAEEVQVLSQFRDKYLLTNTLGRAFVRFYYRHSPRVAEYIKNREWAKRIVRGMLMPVVWVSKWGMRF